jgi:hypothetical protein
MNLGNECPASHGAYFGIFSHHNNIPHGIRIAVEYAMHENMISFVVCTSTLAQGVNLPIRYLIVSRFDQGGKYIKTRDFHNLIGRAGRAGMHTEGSIIFANPKIYDGKNIDNEQKYWQKAQELLEPEKNEPCKSELPTIFDPLKSKNGKDKIPLNTLKFLNSYFESPDLVQSLIDNILLERNQNENFDRESLEHQFLIKINLISAIENFMLSNWDELESLRGNNQYSDIVIKTLGYSLADDEMRSQLSELFNIIEHYIRKNITDPEKRKIYGKTLYGIKDALSIEEWFNNNIQNLREVNNEEGLLGLIWTVLKDTFVNKAGLKITNIDSLQSIIMAWISGVSYSELLNIFSENNIKIKRGEQTRKIDIEVVDICDNTFSFNGCLALNAIYEFTTQDEDANQGVMALLQKFQKRLKYGLPDEASIILYEIGFCDRIISQNIENSLKLSGNDKSQILFEIKSNRDLAMTIISEYPAYYQMKMNRLVN